MGTKNYVIGRAAVGKDFEVLEIDDGAAVPVEVVQPAQYHGTRFGDRSSAEAALKAWVAGVLADGVPEHALRGLKEPEKT